MDKAFILAEIRRVAKANKGVPPGIRRFTSDTGIKESDWLGKIWARWSDALREAGFEPNQLQGAFERADLIERYAGLARELGRLPTANDLRMKSRTDGGFPDAKVFQRLGPKSALVHEVLTYCSGRDGFEDVAAWCRAYELPRNIVARDVPDDPQEEPDFGTVYLLKSGRFYKIGRSNAAGRREYEIGLQLPERATMVHTIQTDDPVGIESYWHRRFEAKRRNGEWFDLEPADVTAFRRRRFM